MFTSVGIKSERSLITGINRVLKPTTFDGETVWLNYRRPFVAVAGKGWTNQENLTRLILAPRAKLEMVAIKCNKYTQVH